MSKTLAPKTNTSTNFVTRAETYIKIFQSRLASLTYKPNCGAMQPLIACCVMVIAIQARPRIVYYPRGNLNPRFLREREMSSASRRQGLASPTMNIKSQINGIPRRSPKRYHGPPPFTSGSLGMALPAFTRHWRLSNLAGKG